MAKHIIFVVVGGQIPQATVLSYNELVALVVEKKQQNQFRLYGPANGMEYGLLKAMNRDTQMPFEAYSMFSAGMGHYFAGKPMAAKVRGALGTLLLVTTEDVFKKLQPELYGEEEEVTLYTLPTTEIPEDPKTVTAYH